MLPRGSGVSLQFGGDVARDADGTPRLTVRCRVILNGDAPYEGVTNSWQVDRIVACGEGEARLRIAVEAMLVLGAVTRDEVVTRGGDVFRHLRLLIADARATLYAQPLGRVEATAPSPAVRIEMRSVGELVAGRSGLIDRRRVRMTASAHRLRVSRMSPADVRRGVAVCDYLADDLLPELARAVRALMGQGRCPVRQKSSDASNARSFTFPKSISFAE
jgi:hypothetical protein